MSIIQTKGKVIFDLPDLTNKHNNQSQWKKTAAILFNDDMCNYYSWFINKRYGIKLSYPIRRAHFTIINDRIDLEHYNKISSNLKGVEISLKYSTDVRTNGNYWWLKVFSEEAIQLRALFGLDKPFFNFHITIGYPFPVDFEHSKYIHSNILKYENNIINE